MTPLPSSKPECCHSRISDILVLYSIFEEPFRSELFRIWVLHGVVQDSPEVSIPSVRWLKINSQDIRDNAPYVSHHDGILWYEVPVVLVVDSCSVWQPYEKMITTVLR